MVARLSLPSPARTIRSIGTLIAALAVSVTVTIGTASAKPRPCRLANTPITRAARAQMRGAVVCLINRERREHGLPGLKASPKLDRSAQDWANIMVRDHSFSHSTAFAARVNDVGFDWSEIGENIASGYTTPVRVVAAWMASPGHCRNILSPDYREVGTGLSNHTIPGFGSQPGTWTQDFGTLLSQPGAGSWGPAEGCPYR